MNEAYIDGYNAGLQQLYVDGFEVGFMQLVEVGIRSAYIEKLVSTYTTEMSSLSLPYRNRYVHKVYIYKDYLLIDMKSQIVSGGHQ